MAETTNKHFIKFSGTKEQFIAKGYPTTYQDKIVFIGNGECIFTRGMYFANFNELITAYVAGMNFLKGVTVDGTSYNAAAGGGYVAFEATDPTTVGVNVNQGKITIGLTTAFLNNITNLGTDITNIKNNYATTSAMNTAIGNAKTELKGTDSDTLNSETIKGAKKYAENVGNTVTTNLKGSDSDTADSETIAGAKKYATEAGNGALDRAKAYADDVAGTAETNAKGYADTKKSEVIGKSGDASTATTIYGAKAYADAKKSEVIGNASTDTKDSKTIEGVRKYVEDKTANIASDSRVQGVEDRVKAIEDDYLVAQDKTDLTGLINTEKGRVDVLVGSDSGKSARAIVQDEVAKQLTSENISDSFDTLKEIAEWLSSHPEDVTAMNEAIEANADAIEVLNGADTVEGSVAKTVKDAVNTVRGWVSEGYATKDQVNAKYTKPSNGIPTSDLASGIVTSLGKADTAYQKASTGIPKTDLESGVQTSLGKADTAVQSVVSGSANGTISVDGTDVAVKGLGSAAYTASTAYATSAQGGKADSALQSVEGSTYVEVTGKSSNKQTISIKKDDIISGLATDANAQGYANTAETNAKSYADSQWEWLDLD